MFLCALFQFLVYPLVIYYYNHWNVHYYHNTHPHLENSPIDAAKYHSPYSSMKDTILHIVDWKVAMSNPMVICIVCCSAVDENCDEDDDGGGLDL